ncbi:MAG TPA: pyruvate ferredoxin oxidoreductase [Anaerolineae bacterium]|nr:pyruvate ferredoxin oxidoreductase [Anaerolineae bacterium]
MMSRIEVRIAGFGGQGIIRSGNIIGTAAAIHDGKYATFTQSYGPESRGGACAAQVIISDEPIHYPHLLDPRILVVMSQGAYNKYVSGLNRDGLLLVDEDLVELGEEAAGLRVLSIPATRLAEEELGRRIVANVVMLGFFAAVTDVVSVDALRQAVLGSVPKGTEELNQRAFELGYEYGRRMADGKWEIGAWRRVC